MLRDLVTRYGARSRLCFGRGHISSDDHLDVHANFLPQHKDHHLDPDTRFVNISPKIPGMNFETLSYNRDVQRRVKCGKNGGPKFHVLGRQRLRENFSVPFFSCFLLSEKSVKKRRRGNKTRKSLLQFKVIYIYRDIYVYIHESRSSETYMREEITCVNNE